MRFTNQIRWAALALCAGAAGTVSAQTGWYGYPFGCGGYHQHHASTAQEGFARGVADVIRARSQAALMDAQAVGYLEDGRRKYLENGNFAVRSFLARRALRDEYRKGADNTFYKSPEKLARYVEKRRLKPLTKSKFFAPSGEISWPLSLATAGDARHRDRVSALVAKWAKARSLVPEESIELAVLLKDWRRKLERNPHELPRSEVVHGARFLDRLAATASGRFPPPTP